MNQVEGSASICDAGGNLLFYTDGSTIWNALHVPMANGTGLNGSFSSTQSALILKRPGSNTQYYVFTQQGQNVANGGLYYSVVDMSLAAGNGSVITKNVSIHQPSGEKIAATRHCNGVDYWVVSRDASSANFRSILLTATGISTNVVISVSPNSVSGFIGTVGQLKLSGDGKKLANCSWNFSIQPLELADFDNSTGLITNFTMLGGGIGTSVYGCEFSPDGSKLYAGTISGGNIYQWNLCAGSPTAIAASQFQLSGTANTGKGSFQLGPDGKIYIARLGQSHLAVIANPNNTGNACNYTEQAISLSPRNSSYGLPNLPTSGIKAQIPMFTHTVSNSFGCQTASFTAPPIANNFTLFGCASAGYSLTSLQWVFGDPASGASNTSTLANPFHAFTSLGTYTTILILNWSCGGGTDTLKQVVNVNIPCISVSSTSITCANLGSATVSALNGVGPFSYTWMPTGQTSSVATGLSPGSYTITVFDFGNNFTYTAQTIFTSLIPLTGTFLHSNSVTCFGAATGTGAVTNLAGGSGNQNYLWLSGSNSYTAASPNNLSAGLWSVTVSDALTGCTISDLFIITQPPAQNPVIVASSPTTCAGSSISFTASNSGGTPGPGAGYTFTWTAGPTGTLHNVNQALAGNYIYTVQSSDGNNCVVSQTVSVDFIPNPTLTVAHTSICPLETGTLTVSGASTYTWASTTLSLTGNSFAQSPTVSTQYTVLGSALSCTSTATASIILKPVPNPVFVSNSPRCQGDNLLFSVGSGTAFVWTGVNAFTSVSANNTLSVCHPTQSGVYQVTVMAANSCTAATQGSVTVHPTPTVTASGGTVCNTQTLQLNSSSFAGSSYVWTGPNNFVSLNQNPALANPPVLASGNYTVKVTSMQGCTNTALAHVTITAMPVISFNSNSPQCFGNTLSFNASATTGALNYSWAGPNGFSSVLQNPNIPNVTVPASGDYTLTVTTGPCISSAAQNATVHPLPMPVAYNTGPACEGKTYQLGVNNSGVVYLWAGPNGYSSSQQNPGFAGAQLSQSGLYTVQVTDANGCLATDVTSVTVLQNPVVNAFGDLVCYAQPAQLSATGADQYSWYGPMNYTASGASPQIPSALNTQVWTYIVTGTAINGCTAVATATVGTRPLPIAQMSITPRVCAKSLVQLQGSGGIQYYWSGPQNFSSTQQNTSFVAANTGYSGTYTLMVSDVYGCRGFTGAQLIVDGEPTGQIAGNLSGCAPFCSSFTLQSNQGGNSLHSGSWSMDNQSQSGQTASYCFNQPGSYMLSVNFEDNQNCRGSITQLVEAFPVPLADFDYSPKKPVENQDVVIFSNSSTGEQQVAWTWFVNDGKNTTYSGEEGSCFFEEAGQYPIALLVQNLWGCEDTVVKTIEVMTDFNVYIPNAFTPNGDGLNDSFYPVLRGVKRFEMRIYDRWGALIFGSDTPDKTWDGTYKGKECKQDVYNYKLVLLNNRGEEKEYSGSLNLMR